MTVELQVQQFAVELYTDRRKARDVSAVVVESMPSVAHVEVTGNATGVFDVLTAQHSTAQHSTAQHPHGITVQVHTSRTTCTNDTIRADLICGGMQGHCQLCRAVLHKVAQLGHQANCRHCHLHAHTHTHTPHTGVPKHLMWGLKRLRKA